MTLVRGIQVLVLLVFLAGCGADGEPVHPTATAGVSVSNSGVRTHGGVGLQKGPLGLFLGF